MIIVQQSTSLIVPVLGLSTDFSNDLFMPLRCLSNSNNLSIVIHRTHSVVRQRSPSNCLTKNKCRVGRLENRCTVQSINGDSGIDGLVKKFLVCPSVHPSVRQKYARLPRLIYVGSRKRGHARRFPIFKRRPPRQYRRIAAE